MKKAFGSLLATGMMMAAVANAEPAEEVRGLDGCSPSRFSRTPEQVIVDHHAALAAGDWAKAACNFAEDVVVQTDMGTVVGRQANIQNLKGMLMMVNQVPNVLNMSSSGPVVFITWNLLRPGLCVPDGTDTYVVEHGEIRFQTAHALFTFCAN